ncbi:MAG: hypothetical protein QM728_08820 [Gordonia sp. (in: high G+C Gram-positive bacteria)]|uniref:hypothetical protein n=1 Tax=Gordonia sp. (in: high G+C Gram-positive bacteria) TaxID=84139 RepID=UPI0039E2E7B1
MRRRPDETGEIDPIPTGELSVIDRPGARKRRPGAGAPKRANRSRAAQRAVSRRAARLAREEQSAQQGTPKGRGARAATPARPSLVERVRALPFAVPVIALVALGLVGTLWLSTRAAQDSYELTVAKVANQTLVDKRDALKRTYESADSSPELADKAARLGLVPVRNAPRLVVGENGRVTVRGTPAPVRGRAPQSINPRPATDNLPHVDPAKVEDSTGLPGGDTAPSDTGQPAPEQNAPAPTATAPGQAQTPGQAPAPGQQPPAPGQPTPPPAPAPAPAAPNVLPAPVAQQQVRQPTSKPRRPATKPRPRAAKPRARSHGAPPRAQRPVNRGAPRANPRPRP